MLQGLRTTIYAVTDLAKATAWYTQLVGHEPYFNEPFYVGYNIGGYELGLIPDTNGNATYWGTPDIDADYARMLALGARSQSAIKEVGEGIRVATMLDPFDNVIGLIENPHFKLDHAA